MINNEYLNNPKQIIQDLLDATIQEYAKNPEKHQGDIIIGAHGTVLSYRDSTQGILAGVIARAVLPATDESVPEGVISASYHLEDLMKVDVFELHSFHKQECTVLRYEDGERKELQVYQDTAQEGLLVRLEWKSELSKMQILAADDIVNSIRTMVSRRSGGKTISWKPEIWFNGNRLKY